MAYAFQISRKKGMQGPTKCTSQQAIMSGEEFIGSMGLKRSKQCVTTPFKMSSHCDRNNIPLLLPGWRQGKKTKNKTESHTDAIIFKTPVFCFFSFLLKYCKRFICKYTNGAYWLTQVALIQHILG